MLDWIFHFSISNPSFTLWVERFAFPIVSAAPALSLVVVTMFLFLPDTFHSFFKQKEKPLTDEEKLGLEPTQQPARGCRIKEAAKSFIGSFFFWLRLLSWLFIVIVFFYNFLPPPSSWMSTHDLALFLGYWGVNIFVILVRLISIRVLVFSVIWPIVKNVFRHSERTAD